MNFVIDLKEAAANVRNTLKTCILNLIVVIQLVIVFPEKIVMVFPKKMLLPEKLLLPKKIPKKILKEILLCREILVSKFTKTR